MHTILSQGYLLFSVSKENFVGYNRARSNRGELGGVNWGKKAESNNGEVEIDKKRKRNVTFNFFLAHQRFRSRFFFKNHCCMFWVFTTNLRFPANKDQTTLGDFWVSNI